MHHVRPVWLVLFGFLLFPCIDFVRAQSTPITSGPKDITDLYDPILDILFPKAEISDRDDLFAATIRFVPADSSTEWQINIVRGKGGQFRVAKYSLPAGSDSIWGRLFHLFATHPETPMDAAQLAKQFKVESREVKAPQEALAALFDLLVQLHIPIKRIDPQTPSLFAVDTNRYEFSYKTQGFGDLQVNYDDFRGLDRNVKKFVQWMKSVAKTVDSGR